MCVHRERERRGNCLCVCEEVGERGQPAESPRSGLGCWNNRATEVGLPQLTACSACSQRAQQTAQHLPCPNQPAQQEDPKARQVHPPIRNCFEQPTEGKAVKPELLQRVSKGSNSPLLEEAVTQEPRGPGRWGVGKPASLDQFVEMQPAGGGGEEGEQQRGF